MERRAEKSSDTRHCVVLAGTNGSKEDGASVVRV